MKTKLTIIRILVIICASFSNDLFGQDEATPTNNPYSEVKKVSKHWTNAIRWNQTVNALEIPNLVDYTSITNHVDSTILVSIMLKIKNQGGGVLYFPPGSYFFDYDLPIYDRVVVRGANPIEEKGLGGDIRQKLITRFEFPKYQPTSVEEGTPINTAFKVIFAKEKLRNAGLVNIDINRGLIDFAGAFKGEAKFQHQNIIILRVRQNNVAFPDPSIPTKFQSLNARGWQRWSWKLASNINLNIAKNCIVTKCLLNDENTDNFPQNHFMINDGMVFDGSQAIFNYSDHLGITINSSLGKLRDIYKNEKNNEVVTVDKTSSSKSAGLEVSDNVIFLCKGNKSIVVYGNKVSFSNNRTELIENNNLIKNGIVIEDERYSILTTEKIPSIAKVIANKNTNESLPYRVVLPSNYDAKRKYPVILFFHHLTESGNDNLIQFRNFLWQFVADGNREKYPCFIVAPQKPNVDVKSEESGWVDDRPALVSWGVPWKLAISIKMINNLKKEYNIDSDRIYVVGIGQGGDAVWDALIRFPNFFAAGVPISSWYEFTDERTSKIVNTPIWMFNGVKVEETTLDPTSTVLALTRMMMVNIFKDTKNVRHTEFPNSGTICWDNIQSIEEFMPWLFSQKKNNNLSFNGK
ncbi:MAG: alpha/beta hydrolase-fold protein [Arcicella sp.]|jgi:predicted peptidase|nr:alpha/beta hydrolase-fold protein [Arcicella sp.]